MKTTVIISSLLITMLATQASAQWSTNWPVPSNATWFIEGQVANYQQELYEGCSERVEAVGTNRVAPLNIVHSYAIWTGTYSNQAVTNEYGTFTNRYHVITNIVVTNQFTSFSTPYGTIRPYITKGFFSAIDSKISQLLPYYVMHEAADPDGQFEGYFDRWTTSTVAFAEPHPRDIPRLTAAYVFLTNGIGETFGITYDDWEEVEGGHAFWTWATPFTNETYILWQWNAYSVDGSETNLAWISSPASGSMAPKAQFWNVDHFPVAHYILAGTNPAPSTDFELTQATIYNTNMPNPGPAVLNDFYFTLTNTTPLVLDLTYAGGPLWSVISALNPTTKPANVHDTVMIKYTNYANTFYRRTDLGGRVANQLLPVALNERQVAINYMRWTWAPHRSFLGGWTVSQDTGADRIYADGLASTYARARASNIFNYASASWSQSPPATRWYKVLASLTPWSPAPYNGQSERMRSTPISDFWFTTDFQSSIDLYFWMESDYDATQSGIDTYSFGTNTKRFVYWETFAERAAHTRGGAPDSATEIGNIAANPMLSFPVGDAPDTAFVECNRMNWVVKWDGTNGFDFLD